MKTSASVTLAILAVITVGAVYVWPYVKMDFTESASYTEQDKRECEFFTPDILKNMPRVSAHYHFGYSNVSGPDLLIYEVTFSGTTHTNRINHYLQKNGFRRLGSCDIDGECWQGDDPGMSVSVSIDAKSEIVIVSVMDKT